MTLAVPGIIVCIAKRRCMAVAVKKVNIIMRLIEFEFLLQYLASATNALEIKQINIQNVTAGMIAYQLQYRTVC